MSIKRSAALGAGLLFLCAARPALANDCANPLISTCINSDNFWPHAGPSRLLTVGGTETVAAGQVAFGLVTSYLSRPIVLHVASPGPGGSDQYAVNDQVNGNFLWSYGVTDRLAFDYALPVTFGQGGGGVSAITGGDGIRDTAMRDMRFGVALALVPRERVDVESTARAGAGSVWSLTSRFEVSAPTGDADQFAGERSGVFVPSVAADYRRGRWFAGAEAGARIRPVTELAGARVGTQALVGAGVGFDILARELLSLTAEGRALPNFPEQHDTQQTSLGFNSKPNGKSIIPAEWTVSVRSAPLLAGDLAFQLGGGGALPLSDAAITTPRFRFTLGLIYAPLGRDSDHDGVVDSRDACPHTPQGEPVAGAPRDGCPHSAPPPPAPADFTAPQADQPPPASPPDSKGLSPQPPPGTLLR